MVVDSVGVFPGETGKEGSEGAWAANDVFELRPFVPRCGRQDFEELYCIMVNWAGTRKATGVDGLENPFVRREGIDRSGDGGVMIMRNAEAGALKFRRDVPLARQEMDESGEFGDEGGPE